MTDADPTADPPAAAAGVPSKAAPAKPSAAYFTSLTLRNVRCFGDEPVTLDLSDGETKPARWTVLLGENGTGKTTVLEAIWALHGVARAGGLFLGRATIAFAKELRELSQTDPDRHDPVVRTAYTIASLLRRGAEEDGAAVLRGCDGTFRTPPTRHWKQELKDGELRQRKFAGGHFPTRLYEVDRVRSGLKRELGTGRAVGTVGPEQWLRDLDYKRLRSKEHADERRYRKALEIVCDLLPNVSDATLEESSGDAFEPPRAFFLSTPDETWLPLSRLAFGYQTLFSLAVNHAARLMYHYGDSSDPLAQSAVLLVDEIELHLHPKMQREVMSKLSEWFPGTQFIVTTHSPLVAQAAAERRANFAVLVRDRDAAGRPTGPVRIENDPEVVDRWRFEQLLASDLFDVSPVPPETQRLLEKRAELLSKPDPTPGEVAEADALGARADELTPDPERAETRRVLREAAEALARYAGDRTGGGETAA